MFQEKNGNGTRQITSGGRLFWWTTRSLRDELTCVLGVEHMARGSADGVVEVLVHPIEESTALSSSPLAILLKYSLAYSN